MTTLARDLDLNLLRIFVVVAESGSVTAAASRLYLTQPAVSAALKRLAAAVGAPLFAKQGRGLALTARGQRLFDDGRPHLEALVAAATSAEPFALAQSTRTVRVGLSDVNEWLLPRLLAAIAREAPKVRIVVLPVQFRTVAHALGSGAVDFAVTVADDVPAGIRREPLFAGGFVCVHDPRHSGVGAKLTRAQYLAHGHAIVSYNGDLRGVVEDVLGVQRDVRISVPGFHPLGAVLEGSALLATVPTSVAAQLLATRRHLASVPLPFVVRSATMELLWREAQEGDPAVAFLLGEVRDAARTMARGGSAGRRRSRMPRTANAGTTKRP